VTKFDVQKIFEILIADQFIRLVIPHYTW